jgi:hypothetical protein
VDLLAAYAVAGRTHEGITVMRTHIRFMWTFASAADIWNWGLVVARTSDVGTTDPAPEINPDLRWLMNEQEFAQATGAATDATVQRDYDIKAKRKITAPGETLVLSLTNATAASHTIPVYARVLLALP